MNYNHKLEAEQLYHEEQLPHSHYHILADRLAPQIMIARWNPQRVKFDGTYLTRYSLFGFYFLN